MKLKDMGIEFPREKTVGALYDYIYRLSEALEIILSEIDEDNLSQSLKQKIDGGGAQK